MAAGYAAGPSAADALGQRVLEAASDLLARGGPAFLTVRDVAAAAGCSTMMIYTLFGGKEQLLVAVYDDGFERLGVALTRCAEEPDALGRLRALARAYRAFGLAHRTLYAAMFSRPVASLRLRGVQAHRRTHSFALLVDAVSYARDTGAVRAQHPAQTVADSLWSAVHGHVSLEASGHFADDAATSGKRFEALLDMLLAGLSTAPVARPAAQRKGRR